MSFVFNPAAITKNLCIQSRLYEWCANSDWNPDRNLKSNFFKHSHYSNGHWNLIDMTIELLMKAHPQTFKKFNCLEGSFAIWGFTMTSKLKLKSSRSSISSQVLTMEYDNDARNTDLWIPKILNTILLCSVEFNHNPVGILAPKFYFQLNPMWNDA